MTDNLNLPRCNCAAPVLDTGYCSECGQQVVPQSNRGITIGARSMTRLDSDRLNLAAGDAEETIWLLREKGARVENNCRALYKQRNRYRRALERLLANAEHIFAKEPVRDWGETLAEAHAALGSVETDEVGLGPEETT